MVFSFQNSALRSENQLPFLEFLPLPVRQTLLLGQLPRISKTTSKTHSIRLTVSSASLPFPFLPPFPRACVQAVYDECRTEGRTYNSSAFNFCPSLCNSPSPLLAFFFPTVFLGTHHTRTTPKRSFGNFEVCLSWSSH